ncbi:amidohydrolase family protein [Parahaliea mediterranea]|uniref:Amidohydrolase family protein n=1 Tax=Parahaliea mediterranea TaxID=651086 RepID=A0A939ILC2_9GAMM|nr:amidohydrolase family protein [Parahaliea mediterranea]MBN7796350.1 amidohydrolase family protein [Parahaliea mediterranea]
MLRTLLRWRAYRPLLLVSACVGLLSGARAADAARVQLYTNLNLIDGTGAAVRRDMALWVEDGVIRAIEPMHALANPDAGVEVIDGEGRYAIPGLIDTHVHMATSPEDEQPLALLERQLYSGITSVRDMAGDVRVLSGLARDTRLGRIAGPDLYYVALMAGESFFDDPRPASSARGETPGAVPWMQAIDADTDMPQAVALARGTWATGIKIYADLPATDVRRITAEGHRQGMKVWAHSTVFPASPGEVVEAGVDTISHVCRLVFETVAIPPANYDHDMAPDYAGTDPADPRIVAVLEAMRERGTVLDATVALYARALARAEAEASAESEPYRGCPPAFAAALTREALDRGVAVSTGSDFVAPADSPWPALFEEMVFLQREVGMEPLQVIRAATLVGARVLGIDESAGSLEVGKRADLVLLDRDPSRDLDNLHSVSLTVKAGERYPRTDFHGVRHD